MPRAGRKTKRHVLGCALVVATVAVAIRLSWPHERLLLEVAHPMCHIDKGRDGAGVLWQRTYWLDSNRLLLVTPDRPGGMGVSTEGHAELFDRTIRTKTPLVGLTKLLNKPGYYPGRRPVDFQLSPDGTRLYWRAWYGPTVATLNGTLLRRWEVKYSRLIFWMNYQDVVEAMWDKSDQLSQLKIHDATTSHGDRNVEPSSPEIPGILARYDINNPIVTDTGYVDRDHCEITRRWFDKASGQIVKRTDIVPLPHITTVHWWRDDVHHSAKPFVLQRSETPPLLTWLHRFFPSISVKPVVTEGLWISRVGARQMQEIGHIPMDLENLSLRGTGDHLELEQVQMLPDGNQLSFIYKGMLYLVPIKISH